MDLRKMQRRTLSNVFDDAIATCIGRDDRRCTDGALALKHTLQGQK